MKNLTKFVLSAALCGVFAGCGGDSGASASDDVSSSSSSHSELVSESTSSSSSSVDPEIPQGDESSSGLNASSSSHSELVSESTSSSSSENVDSESSQGDESNSSSVESSSSEVSSSSFSGIDPSTVVKGTMTDERDGKIYKTVTIGEQTWMAENLNYAYNEPTTQWDSSSFCYENSADSCSKYGRLYLWSAAMDSAAVFSDDGKECGDGSYCSVAPVRGVCPEGWHLPSYSEWSTLITAVGGKNTAGKVLSSTSGWYSSRNGEDSYGFSVVPAGSRNDDGGFYSVGSFACFWSSSDYYSSYAYIWYFHYDYANVGESYTYKYYAYSVRCLKDSD